jgi:rubrerythrin
MTESRISEALGVGIQMEEKGVEFYTQAAERMLHPFGKRMFLSLAADEKRHAEMFREMAAQEGLRPAGADEIDKEGPMKRISGIFRAMADELKADIKPSDDDLGVIRKALELEKKAFDAYTQWAKESRDATESGILELMALEENEHWRILDDTLLYLTKPEEWQIKEEKPLIDGG